MCSVIVGVHETEPVNASFIQIAKAIFKVNVVINEISSNVILG